MLLPLYESRPFFILSRLRGILVGFLRSRDNIFQLNASSRDEKRPALIFLEISSNCKTCPYLFVSWLRLNYFLKESANQSCLKKDSPKVPEHIKKDLYMNSQ